MSTPTSDDRILGIDPGLNTTGYGILDVSRAGLKIVEAGVIRTPPRALETKLAEVHAGIREVIAAFGPRSVAIEELYSHYARPRTAILMGHARGVICLAARQAGVPIVHYAATQVKRMLTGNGRAPKSQMQLAICREFGLLAAPEPPDVADALAIAMCHYYLGRKVA